VLQLESGENVHKALEILKTKALTPELVRVDFTGRRGGGGEEFWRNEVVAKTIPFY
jgi:hypothetical protein